MRPILMIALLINTTVAAGSAQTVKLDPNQNHLFLVADKAATLQPHLDQGAAHGLQVIFGNNQGIYLRRVEGQGSPEAYRAIMDDSTQDFEKGLNAEGERGYRVIPTTLTRAGNNSVAIMRRRGEDSTAFRYRVLPSDDALEKKLGDLRSKGFSVIGVFTQQSGMAAAMGRPGRMHVVLEASGGTDAPSGSGSAVLKWRAVSTLRASTLEKELNEAGANGYRVRGGSFMNVLVEQAEPAAKFSYRVIGTRRANTAIEEIQQAGRDGYRVLPFAIMDNPSTKLEVVFLLERSAASAPSYEYVPSELGSHTLLDGLVTKGFTPAALVYQGDYFILFERPS
jgi:hypothetical protein